MNITDLINSDIQRYKEQYPNTSQDGETLYQVQARNNNIIIQDLMTAPKHDIIVHKFKMFNDMAHGTILIYLLTADEINDNILPMIGIELGDGNMTHLRLKYVYDRQHNDYRVILYTPTDHEIIEINKAYIGNHKIIYHVLNYLSHPSIIDVARNNHIY